jgi:hypothetical protein
VKSVIDRLTFSISFVYRYAHIKNCAQYNSKGKDMNLKKLRFWNTQDQFESVVQPHESLEQAAQGQDALSNVIKLPLDNPLIQPAGLTDQDDASKVTTPKHLGVLDSTEIKEFFKQNHFGLGRHNGSVYRTQSSLELGKKSIVSEFQNILHELYERNKVKHQKLHLKSLETIGLCDVTSSMLDYAKESVQKDMVLLSEQITLAENGKGWVLEALNSYQIGFGKGVREAIEFEHI